MWRGVQALALTLLIAATSPANLALAAPQAELDSAPDGTLVVVGSGWHPAQQLVVSLGGDRFAAYPDSGGSFEVPTGLATHRGPLGIHRLQTADLAFMPIEQVADAAPNPLSVLFAQSLLSGTLWLGGALGALALARIIARQGWRRS